MKQPEEKRKLILIEQAWEDESGQYHDEYAELVEINEDGTLKLEFPNSNQRVRNYLHKCEFKAEDYKDQLDESRPTPPEAADINVAHLAAGKAIPDWDIENLASRLHQVYQEELERQGKKSKHSDFYTELSEEIKDLDRALARYINEFIIPNALKQQRSEVAREINTQLLKAVESGATNTLSMAIKIVKDIEEN